MPSLLMRSMVRSGGRSPMSARKFSNFCHRLHTVMPRPPYPGYSELFLLRQRDSIPLHVQYVEFVFLRVLKPCLRLLAFSTSSLRHPHERVLPLRKLLRVATIRAPQSQRHRQQTYLDFLVEIPSTVNRPKRWPRIASWLGIVNPSPGLLLSSGGQTFSRSGRCALIP